ncbi:hypothetical protein [Neolewinella antarctica]|uniref:Uncharacterized protein n=1 Tax=Neolewinella antarctica TaxID=442734 RepID=A0ABX0X9R3_9BACT|nr:hypothetical protein [Neolewinella antarctica]NJC25664.1 hypothetical protein [Neolewinella antarctica]
MLGLLAGLLCTFALNAQFSEIHLDSGGEERASELLVVGDRIMIAGSTTAGATDRNNGLYHLLDLRGRLLHSKELNLDRRTFINASSGVNDGEFMLGGWVNNFGLSDDMAFYRIDTAGTTVASWRYGDFADDEQVNAIARIDDNNFLAVGNIGSSNLATALLIDSTGNLRWRRTRISPGRHHLLRRRFNCG